MTCFYSIHIFYILPVLSAQLFPDRIQKSPLISKQKCNSRSIVNMHTWIDETDPMKNALFEMHIKPIPWTTDTGIRKS
jgi:hypothetical protein